MRTLRLVFPIALAFAGFAACGGTELVPSDSSNPTTGGSTSSGGGPSDGGQQSTGGNGLGGDTLGGAAGMTSTGGSEAGTGGSGPGCAPRVHVLLQRSGAMFNFPGAEDSWWDAVAEALASEGGLLEEFGADLDVSVSVFTRVMDEACPIGTSVSAPAAADEVADLLADEKADYEQLTENTIKVDAPVVEAVEGATTLLGDVEGATIVLILSGIPDSCTTTDLHCTSQDVFTAVQAAHAEGIETRLVYLSSENIERYPEGVANAGVGLGITDTSLGCAEPFEYSENPGSAPFAAPEDTGAVAEALEGLFDELATCE